MLSPQIAGNRVVKQQRNSGAFTLVELLVVLGVVVILSVVLVPALAATKPNSKVAQCLNNQRQLSLAWQMYAADNADLIVTATAWVQNNPGMDWTSSSANTNTDYLTNPTNALIARYVKSAAIFKCPADYYQSPAQSLIGPRVRSCSMNGAVGAFTPTVHGPAPGGGTFYGGGGLGATKKMADLIMPGPANIFLFLDEHPDSINDAIFAFNPGYPVGQETWRDLPASYHNGAVGISYADGHAEIHKWLDSRTVKPVIYSPWASQYPGGYIVQQSADYEWLNARMPYR